MLPRKKKPEGPYEVDTTKEVDMTKQAAAPAPEDTIEICDDNDNDEWARGQDEDDDNTLHPRTARKQGYENDPEEESLFSNESDNNHDENDPDNHYSESTGDENKKKRSKRKTPTSTIRTPSKTHWSGRTSPAAQESETVLFAIGANPNVVKFMVSYGLDEITKIQQLTSTTILLYANISRKNMPRSDIVSTRFILDLKKVAFKMTHIKHRISCAINPADIDKTWCRSMNDQFDLERGWKNDTLKYLYPTQAHLTKSTKWMEMLQNVLRMIREIMN